MEAEEIVLLLTADFRAATPLQVPELGSAKDVWQRESKHWAASGIFLVQKRAFLVSDLYLISSIL